MVQQRYWLNQMQQLLQLLLVVEQQLIEHNMLDNTKQLHQEVHFVVAVVVGIQVVELLIAVEVVGLLDPKKQNI